MKRIILCVCILFLATSVYARPNRALKNKLRKVETKLEVTTQNYQALARQVLILVKKLQGIKTLQDLDKILNSMNVKRTKEVVPVKP